MNFVIKPYKDWDSTDAQDIEAPDIFKACELYSEINKFVGILLVVLPTLEAKLIFITYDYPHYIALRRIRVPKEKLDDFFPIRA